MQGHGAIEVGLGGSHANGDGRHLDDFGAVLTHHLAAEHLAACHLHHQLEQHGRAAFGQGLGHGAELGPVHLHAIGAATGDRRLFAQAHGGQLGLAEHGHRHQVVVHLAGFVAVHAVGKGAAFVDGHGGEVDAVGHITHGVDVGHGGGLVGIHREAMPFGYQAGGLQLQTLEEGLAAGGEQHPAAAERFAAAIGPRNSDLQRTRFTADGCWAGARAHLDALSDHRLLHGEGCFAIETPQDLLAPHQLDHFHPQAVEDAGEFTGDEAGAHDHHPLGEGFQFKHRIADPAQLGAGNGGALGPSAHGDQDPLSAVMPLAVLGAAHRQGVGVVEATPALDQLHPCLLKKSEVELVEPVHLGAHMAQQGAGVGAIASEFPAVAGRIGEQVAVGGAIHQQFFGHAAADHAGAAHPVALDDAHLGAVAGGPFGGGQATGACAQHQQIEGVAHGGESLMAAILAGAGPGPVLAQPIKKPPRWAGGQGNGWVPD